MGTLHYRLRVRDPWDTTDVLVVSTVPADDNPFITEPPEGDGTKIDPLSGKVEVGEYVIHVADEIGTITLPTLLFSENWTYEDQTARNLVWAKTADQAAAYAGGDNAGFDGNPLHVGITYGGGLGGGGGYGKHTLTLDSGDGIEAGESYTVVCEWMRLSRELGALDDCGISINGGEGVTCYDTHGVLEGPCVVQGTANGSGELVITLGHFDLEFGMTGIVLEFGPIRVFGPSEEIETRVVTGWHGDDDGRWQVLGCKAFLDESTNVGSNWTTVAGMYVTNTTLAGGIEWAITLGESDRRERSVMVFTKEEGLFEATRLIGAPPGFGPLPDAPYDTWRFEVADTGDTSGNLPSDAVVLDFDRGWMYEHRGGPFESDFEGITEKHGEISNETRTLVNQIAPGYAVTSGGVTTLEGLTAYVYTDVSGQPGDLVGTFGVYGWTTDPGVEGVYAFVGKGDELIVHDRRIALKWGPGDGATTTLPSQGTVYHVIVTPDAVSEDNPLHFTGHLVDFVTELFRLRQIPFDQASADAVKAAMGQMRAFYRFTAPEPLMDAVANYAFGPGGFAVRPTETGEWEFILTRHLPSATPSETLDESKVHDPETVIFALDVGSIVNRVVWKQQHWTRWKESMETDPPVDGIIGREVVSIVEPELSLIADLGVREITYDLPGEIIIKSGSSPKVSALAWFTVMGEDILRRWGRGNPEATVKALRGQSSADIGDFLILDLDHKPNAETGQSPTAQRGGQRIVQVTHRTRTPAGFEHTVLDVGPADAATELVPEFTLELTSDDPRHTAQATLTNHDDLAGFLVRMEMGTGASEPDGGITVAVFTPDDLPHRTFPEEAGTTVWVRMRAEPEAGGVPGPWSDWDSVTLDAIPAVTDLSADAGSNCTEEVVTWTVGDATLPVRVRWKATAASDYTSVVILPAGSEAYTIGGVVPGTAMTVEVAHLDVAPFSGVGTVATDTWTACGTTPTLNPPVDPLGATNGAGLVILEVTGTEFPSNTVFEMAVETAVGAGTYGSYAVMASPVTTEGRIHFETTRPNDGLTVSVRAKHTRSGWTDSAYTTPVIVDPWGDPDPIPPGGGVSIADAVDTVPIWSAAVDEDRELVDYEEDGAIYLGFSQDSGATFTPAGPSTTPSLPLVTAGDIYTAWTAVVPECVGDPLFGFFHADGVEVDAAWRFRRPMNGTESVRLQCRVVQAGVVGTSPCIKDMIVQIWRTAAAVAAPSEDPPEEPTFEFDTTDLKIHYKTDAGITVDGSNHVTAVVDQAAPETNPDEIGGTPLLVASGVNGLPIIRFNGTDHLRLADAFTGRTAGHLFLAIKMLSNSPADAADGGLMEFGGGGEGLNSNFYPFSPNGNAYLDYGSDVRHVFSLASVNVAAWHVFEIEAEDDYWCFRYNGQVIHETASNTFALSSQAFFGRGSTLLGDEGFFDFLEFIDFSERQDAENAALVRAYLYNRLGIAP